MLVFNISKLKFSHYFNVESVQLVYKYIVSSMADAPSSQSDNAAYRWTGKLHRDCDLEELLLDNTVDRSK
jgi:hypothetical protein